MLELIGFGEDISKVRSRISDNLEIFLSPEYADYITKEVADNFERYLEAGKATGDLFFPIKALVNGMLEGLEMHYLKIFIEESLKDIQANPYHINRFNILLIEVFFSSEADADPPHLDYLSKLVQRKHEKTLVNVQEFLKKGKNRAAISNYLRMFKNEDQSEEHFDLYTAYTLRQTTASKVGDFLKATQADYKGDFSRFLDHLLLDHEELIPPKILKAAKAWLRALKKAEKQRKFAENGAHFLKGTQAASESFVTIPGNLAPEQLQKFFSFLYLEKNGSPDGEPFLKETEVRELLQRGFGYPEKEPAQKPFSLRLNAHKTHGMVYYALYLLYCRHRTLYPKRNYKDHFAYFLKHNFDNFNEPIEVIRNCIRSRKPKKMNRRFDLGRYLETENDEEFS